MTTGLHSSLYSTTFDSATFFASSMLYKSFMPTSGLAATSLINALSIQAIEFLETPEQKTAQVIVGLVLGTCLINLLAKPLVKGITINPFATVQLAGIHLIIKTTAYAAYQLTLNHYEKWRYGTFNSFDDLKNLTPTQVGKSKAYFEKHPSIWNKYSFKLQAAFNLLLQENNLETLEFTNCSKNTTLNDRELAVFLGTLDEEATLTEKQFQVLKTHETPANTKLYHQFFSKADIDVNEEQQVHFAKVFYDYSLPPPYDTFLPSLDFPPAKDAVDEVQALYYRSYFECYPSEFDSLPLNDQFLLNVIFEKCGPPHTLREPKLSELDSLSSDALEYYKDIYENDPSKWKAKEVKFQVMFNDALEGHYLEPIATPETPMTTWQKVGIAALGCFLLIGGVYTTAYFRASQSQQKQFPLPKIQDDHPKQTSAIIPPLNRTSSSIPIQDVTKPLQLPICPLNDSPQYTNTSSNENNIPKVFPFELRAPQIMFPCVYLPPRTIDNEDTSKVLTLYVDLPALYSQPTKTASPAQEISESTPLPHEIPKVESASYRQWFPLPIIGTFVLWIFCAPKKKTAVTPINPPVVEFCEDSPDLPPYIEQLTWDKDKAAAITLDTKYVNIMLPKALATTKATVTFSTGRSHDKKGISKIPNTLRYLAQNRWQTLAKVVTFVALELIENHYGEAKSIHFNVTTKDNKVLLEIDTTILETVHKVKAVFDSLEKLDELDPSSFDVS